MNVSERGGAGVGGLKSDRGMTCRRGPTHRKSGRRACRDMVNGCIRWHLFERRNNTPSADGGLTARPVPL